MTKKWGEGVMVIPAPREVDALMRKVPRGKLTTLNELRTALARQHKADFGCPITTGIFAWIAAHAAEEAAVEGRKRITPYWRHAQDRRRAEPQVSRRHPGAEETSRRGRPQGDAEGEAPPRRRLREGVVLSVSLTPALVAAEVTRL